ASFTVVRLPQGEVSIAFWSATTRDKVIGVQHFDDPVFRLFSLKDIASKRKIYIYSMDEGMVCSGRAPSPPKGFIGSVMKDEGVSAMKVGGSFVCPHLEKAPGPNLHLWFKSTGEGLRLCPRCAREDRNTAILLLQRIVGRRIEEDMGAEADLGIIWSDKNTQLGKAQVEKVYLGGLVSDEKAFTDALSKAKEGIISGSAFAAGGKGFTDPEAFIKYLSGDEDEKTALRAMLKSVSEGVHAPEPTVNSVLFQIWAEHGLIGLEAVVKDRSIAKRIFEARNLDDMGPGQIIAEAILEEKKKALVSSLPRFKSLGSFTSFADGAARAYRIGEKKGLLFHIRNAKIGDTRTKSLAYAFLRSVGEESSFGWKYSDNEKEFAEYLEPFAKSLLSCPDGDYKDALVALAQASGCGDNVC
ncbi:MAG: hypothetical protein QCI38_08960, partial [Candidatus Thermoplasmatota archaeon]|nr:hypothetical protein [Candidatus Thermoplasmatota archaeon]